MKKFNQFIKKDLNKPQYEAVTHIGGPIIVVAGAGSGKTRVITARMANLILNKEVSPESIVALTFTNKAANEMKERLINYLETKNKLPFVGTFHSYCLLLLKTNSNLLKYSNFSIMDTDDQKSLIKKIIKKYSLEKQFSATELIYQISNLKNKLTLNFEEFSTPIVKEIYLEYESEKASSHCLDFDDLILEILRIFKENKNFSKKFQKKIKHILVDEYQDTNIVQHELLKYMALNSKNKFCLNSLCAVGDEDQSIYSWRGAIATNMQKFQKDFKPVTLIKVEQNYRSVQPILNAANNLILNNKERTHKKLWSDKKAKNRILTITCRSGKQEANAIATYISCLPKKKPLNEIAILYRTHYQSRNIEEAFLNNSIAYKIIGGIRFYERKEIKDILSYLKLIINPHDRISLFRIINRPTRGLGEKFEELVYQEWNKNPLLNFKQLLNYIIDNSDITNNKKESIKSFLDIYQNISKLKKASKQAEKILELTGYIKYLQKNLNPNETESKVENIKELIQSIYNFEKDSSKNSLKEFLTQVILMQEKMNDKQNIQNQVQCMTLHAAKGLEFNTIFIIGLEEGVLPSSRSLNTNKELEEERRLFYVGITRAKERLIFSHTNYRNSYGQITDQVISRFLDEIPANLIKYMDISEDNIAQTKMLFKNWLGIKNKNILTFQDFAKKLNPNLKPQKNYPIKKTKKTFPINSIWKKNQFVNHKKFGIGLIKKIEKKDNEHYYLTIIFKTGEKKILSNFVTKI